MMTHFLWGVFPYIAIVLFFAVPLMRMANRPFSWSTRASTLFARKSIGFASTSMHWGLFLVLLGHLIGLFGGLVGSEVAMTVFLWTGLLGGIAVLVGSATALLRRLTVPEVRAMSQLDDYLIHVLLIPIVGLALYQVMVHRIFGIAFNASAWVASLWRLSPQPELMASSSLITKLHVFLAMVFFAYFPFTKLVHAWTYPINYFVRPFQSMRTPRYPHERKWELRLRSDKSWLVYGLGSVIVVFAVAAGLLGRSSQAVATAKTSGRAAETRADDGRLVGEALYVSQCARCHGVGGRGRGPGADSPKFAEPPRDLRNDGFRFVSTTNGVATKADLRRTIRQGLPAAGMPAFNELSERQVRSLVDVLQDMRGTRPEPAERIEPPASPEVTPALLGRGQKVYERSCASCHGKKGEGDGIAAGSIADADGNHVPPRDFTTGRLKTGTAPRQMYLRVAAGIPSTEGYLMPAFHSSLSPRETWAVVHYVRDELVTRH